jgi:hypothetical protein
MSQVGRKILLLDANVVAGYYLPRSLDSAKARARIQIILDSVRCGKSDCFLYIPNFCIAETFSVFMKHSFGQWNRHVKKAGGTIDRRVYEGLVEQFQKDIHNGRFINQYELSRYHILGINLVAPIDHYFQITRGHKKNHRPMGTFDHLIISMGIQLAHVHGAENVVVVTADSRLTDVLDKCKAGLKPSVVRKLKFHIAERVTGRPFGVDRYPQHANLKDATNAELASTFGEWPLPVAKIGKVYRWLK